MQVLRPWPSFRRRSAGVLVMPLLLGLTTAASGSPRAVAPAPPPAALAPQPEPAIAATGVEGDYLRAIHSRIHERWTKGFIETTAARAVAPNPLAEPSRQVLVLFAVRWDGTVAEANVGKSSGLPAFDKAAVDAIRTADRFPVPPVDVFSDDGVVHLRWVMARDHRLCSGAQLVRREDPLDDALPRLFVQGRTKEALLRVKRSLDAGKSAGTVAGDPMSLFARAWLSRQNPDLVADVDAAAALTRVGDTRHLDRLRAGLAFPVTAPAAAAALTAAKVDLCPAVRDRLLTGDANARLLAIGILRDAAQPLAEQSPCAQALGAVASDAKQVGNVRAAALRALGRLSEPVGNRLWPALIKETDAAVRAAAVSASARPGGGRPALYRLIPFLRDPSVDVRAAAAAGMVRAAGDLALEQLVGVLKDPDPRIGVALAAELAKLPSPGAAALLGRLAKREAVDVRVAAVTALAARTDAPAKALLTPILDVARNDARTPAAIRQLALASAGAGQIQALANDPQFALTAFRGLLAAHKHAEAADVLVTQFDHLPPRALVGFLAAWLETPPSAAARLSTTASEQPAEPDANQ